MLTDIHEPFPCGCVSYAPGRHVVAIGPVLVIAARPYPCFKKWAFPVHAIATGHEQGVGNAGIRVCRNPLAIRHEPLWKGDQQMLGSRAWQRGVRVKVLRRSARYI